MIGYQLLGRSMEKSEPMDYASTGVDIDAESLAVSSLISALSKSPRKTGQKGAPVDLPGGFGGIIEFGDSRLALATDGVGSKLQLANELKRWEGVGIDCVAMNVNDLLCVGAEPLAFVDYIAVPKTDPDVHAILGASLSEACKRSRITLAGGETATLPGIVNELDMSGTALGWFPKGHAITGESLDAGDILIGLPSSGIHSNGFSLVRAVLERSGLALDDNAPFDTNHLGREVERFPNSTGEITIGEVLLNPTRIYVDPVIDLILSCRDGRGPCNSSDLKALAHITGGGLSNLLRLHDSLGWDITDPMPIPPEFSWIEEVGSVDSREMHRTFNMGMGMVIAVSSDRAADIVKWLNKKLLGCKIIGVVTNQGRKVTHVDPTVNFEHY